MSDPITFGLIILGLLLGSAILTACLSANANLKANAHWPLVVACVLSAVFAILILDEVAGASDPARFLSQPITWFAAGKLDVHFTLAIDPLSAVMLAMITFVAIWIAVFSSGYMRDSHHQPDKGYTRFFAMMSLFVFSMCGLVLANNFLLLMAFWEGVGLCSYLLIGYHYERPSAAAAARKAFLVTRLGDVGFVLGIFLIWKLGGWNTDMTAAFDYIQKNPPETASITTACLLLFCGAVGKSAQFPLYIWLPDAMEGPTPVSALIHAATMVTAGVYLVARCAPLFALAPDAREIVAWIGGITALLAAFLAIGQYDLKRVLAYSTVSQLGFMFLALGTLGSVSPIFAVTAAMFHLFTHAFFKALLFLASGSVMHAMGDVIDMRRFGGLKRLMPTTHLTFLCGAAALAGIPLLSGFWSKDLILESLQQAAERSHPHFGSFYFLLLTALLTAALTAFYTFRAYFLTFHGLTRVPEEAGHHVHESPSVMTVPLLVLAIGALLIGAIVEPFTHWFSGFLGRTPSLQMASAMTHFQEVGHHFNWGMAGLSTLLALGGVGIAYMLHGHGRSDVEPAALEPVYSLSRKKLYVDEVFAAAIVKPAETLAFLARVFDQFLDSLARLFAAVPRLIGVWARPIQNGLVQFYALSMALGLGVFLMFVVFRITR
jgi:proton-translocating NADH-quinone oxidoreductase chain L